MFVQKHTQYNTFSNTLNKKAQPNKRPKNKNIQRVSHAIFVEPIRT